MDQGSLSMCIGSDNNLAVRETEASAIGGDLRAVYLNVSSLGNDHKYRLLTNPFVTNRNYKFPSVDDGSDRKR